MLTKQRRLSFSRKFIASRDRPKIGFVLKIAAAIVDYEIAFVMSLQQQQLLYFFIAFAWKAPQFDSESCN